MTGISIVLHSITYTLLYIRLRVTLLHEEAPELVDSQLMGWEEIRAYAAECILK